MATEMRQTATEPIDYGGFDSAIGLNWYLIDPNLRAIMDRHLERDQRDWAEEQLVRWGELCGGAVGGRGGGHRPAPPEIRERVLPRLQSPSFDGSWDGAMFMTEIRGGSDLASSEATARPDGDRWLLNGSKWFCSNVDAKAIVTLARPEGAAPGLRGLGLFLVPAERADGSRNGIRIKRVQDKLGTRSVPTAEVDLVDAEAYILSSAKADASSEARGLNRMMGLVNGSRLGGARRNIIGLAVRRAMAKESAHDALFDRVDAAIAAGDQPGLAAVRDAVVQ